MLYREIIAVCSQIDRKHLNTLCGQNVNLSNVNLTLSQEQAAPSHIAKSCSERRCTAP